MPNNLFLSKKSFFQLFSLNERLFFASFRLNGYLCTVCARVLRAIMNDEQKQ